MATIPRKIEIRPWTMTSAEEASLRGTDATFEWLCNLSGESLRRYAGQWVAARDCSIIAAGPTMEEMLRQLGDVDLQTVVLHHFRRPAWTVYS